MANSGTPPSMETPLYPLGSIDNSRVPYEVSPYGQMQHEEIFRFCPSSSQGQSLNKQKRQEYENVSNQNSNFVQQQQAHKQPASAPPHPDCAQTSHPLESKPCDDSETPLPTMPGNPSSNSCSNGERESSTPVESKQPAATQPSLSEQIAHGCPAPNPKHPGVAVQAAAQKSGCGDPVRQSQQPGLDPRKSRAGKSNNITSRAEKHECCNTTCGGGGQEVVVCDSPSTRKAAHSHSPLGAVFKSIAGFLGLKENSVDFENDTTIAKRFHNKIEELREENDHQAKTINDLLWKIEGWSNQHMASKSKIANLSGENYSLRGAISSLQNTKAKTDSKVVDLTNLIDGYKATAARLTAQLSSLEQSNSKSISGTGAHKDSPAIPPNLLKSVFVMRETALAYTKTFIAYLKNLKAFDSHEALRGVPPESDERFRKYAVEAYICSRLFAGFENDRYVDDSLESRYPYIPAHFDEEDYFLHVQDLELRRQRYLSQYNQLQNQGVQGYMEKIMESDDFAFCTPFGKFCCRKLVKIMGPDWKWAGADAERSILHKLAMNPKDCEKVLKPFLNLAWNAFMLHRLAFQFNPPVRIFRYARKAPFDPTFMEAAVPIDDDDIDEELVVGHMLVPGFQVGATIIKCSVFLVQRSVTPASAPGV